MALPLHPRCLLVALVLGLAALPAPALAQDDDDFDFLDDAEDSDEEKEGEEEGEEEGGETPAEEGDSGELGFDGTPTEEEEDFDFTQPDEEGELDDVQLDAQGLDDAASYKAKQKEVEGMSPEDESLEWERYLRKYPNSQFESRIEARLDKLADQMYSGRIETTEEVEEKGLAELNFSQSFSLENIDPRSKLRAGIEFGLPGYLAPVLDFEWAFLRSLSAHLGARGRYGGISFEPGVRWALVKSARTNTLLTLMGDVRVNTNPAYAGIRPQLGFGQRIALKALDIDAQLQGGTELVTYGIFSPRVVGGANVTFAPGDTVKFYLETSTYMKDLGWEEGGSFRFNTIGFGVKFMERGKGRDSRFEAGGGAIAPYSANYWSFHSGALGLDVNYFL